MASPSTSTFRSATVSRLSGGGRAGKILARRLRGLLLLLEWREDIAAEPAAAATLPRLPLGRTGEAAEIEELRRCRSRHPDQSAIATASATSGPVSVNTRKRT